MKGIAANNWAWVSETNRPQSEKTVETFVREAAGAGYDALEFLGEGVAEAIGAYGVKICGTYTGGPLHLPWEQFDAEACFLAPARKLADLGGDYLAVNADPKGQWDSRQRKTEDELKQQGENLSRLAGLVAPLGLSVVMHNHADSPDLHADDLKSVVEYSDPAVGVQLDTGWCMTSGDEPVARARALGGRLGGLHLRNQRGKVPTEWLGEGDIDMAALVGVLKDVGYAGWLTTELWHREDVAVTQSLLEDQRRSVALLRELWG